MKRLTIFYNKNRVSLSGPIDKLWQKRYTLPMLSIKNESSDYKIIKIMVVAITSMVTLHIALIYSNAYNSLS